MLIFCLNNARSQFDSDLKYFVSLDGYQYCQTNNSDVTGDPCLYYICETNQCVQCNSDYIVLLLVDSTTTVCATFDDTEQYCIADADYYDVGGDYPYDNSFFGNYYTLFKNTFGFQYYCIAYDSYYQDTCGDNLIEYDPTNTEEYYSDQQSHIVSQYTYGSVIGCAYCNVTGLEQRSLINSKIYEEIGYYYYDYAFALLDNPPELYISTCAAGSNYGSKNCNIYEYYNTVRGECEPCSCKFDYCLMCNSSQCLLHDPDLEYFTEFYDFQSTKCLNDPCQSYVQGTKQCSVCSKFSCIVDYSTDTYDCNYYSYLFVDANTISCSYISTFQSQSGPGQTFLQCTAGNNWYKSINADYFNVSYNATAKATHSSNCIACDQYYKISNTINTCLDDCTLNTSYSLVETIINSVSLGCSVCKEGYQNQQLVNITSIQNQVIYIRQCVLNHENSVYCNITDYYHPYFKTCMRCACKFTNCAACTFDQCTLFLNITIPTDNCTSSEDPCTEYVDNSTQKQCKRCLGITTNLLNPYTGTYYPSPYRLLVVDDQTTICANLVPASFQNKDEDNYYCTLNDAYYRANASLIKYYNKFYLSNSKYQHCIACDDYFQIIIDTKVSSKCADQCINDGSKLNYIQRSINSVSIGCGVCGINGLKNEVVKPLSQIDNLFLKTCEASKQDMFGKELNCKFNEVYDEFTSTCKTCSNLFPNCAACNTTYCFLCAENYYLGYTKFYDYSSSQFTYQYICIFQRCPIGQGIKTLGSQECVNCGIANCMYCGQQKTAAGALQFQCLQCLDGYSLIFDNVNKVATGCTAEPATPQNLIYYIASGAAFIQPVDPQLTKTYYTNSGTNPDSPYYFIQSALTDISAKSAANPIINAVIKIGKGKHFFFFCYGQYTNKLTINTKSTVEYCDFKSNLNLAKMLLKQKFYSDQISITFEAMECEKGSPDEQSNTNFLNLCIRDLTPDKRPIIIVNRATSYFNLVGTATFQNLNFTGINQLASSLSSTVQAAIIPEQFCDIVLEPSIYSFTLTLELQNNNYIDYFKCSDPLRIDQYSHIPTSSYDTFTCETNDDSEFYLKQESASLTSYGELFQSTFFEQGDSYAQTYSKVYPKRHQTLINIAALPDYLSSTQTVPTLTITNCSFEYFLNYDSLINIETNDFSNTTITQSYNGENNNLQTQSYQFFIDNGAQRGAKLWIDSSTFKHSNFKKGMIVYRKSQYLTNQFGMNNYTYYYMEVPVSQYLYANPQYIVLVNSLFYNLNYLTNLTSLAIIQKGAAKKYIYDYSGQISISYSPFFNYGIVLNIEDFPGNVEISKNNFTGNMHFIPSIFMNNHSSSLVKDYSSFKDISYTQEFKMAKCDLDEKKDKYFLDQGISQNDDLDDYYDYFERASTIYISRQSGSLIVRNNYFSRNIGTFGGAISINSPNRKSDETSSSSIIFYKNTFSRNMAYISGNAVYIRLTKTASNMSNICGTGILFASNTFKKNIGMKTHNGGAVSQVCSFISAQHEDYRFSSSYWKLEEYERYALQISYSTPDLINTLSSFNVPLFSSQFLNNDFEENYSGQKGTALYLKYINIIDINDNKFTSNGPVYAYYETLYSPYTKYFSKRPMTYYLEEFGCVNEFQFVSVCTTIDNYIDFPHVEGALYVEHCQLGSCLLDLNIMQLNITNVVFKNNQAGPILDSNFPSNLASQLKIVGGFENYLSQITMESITEKMNYVITLYNQPLVYYFPTDYFTYSQTPLITIIVSPFANLVTTTYTFLTQFKYCKFIDNSHMQVLGLSSIQQFQGSLIQYKTSLGETTSNFIPILEMKNNVISDNQFIGPLSSLIYIYNGLLNFQNNQANSNGKISSVVKTTTSFQASLGLPFSSYSTELSQQFGIITIEGLNAFPLKSYHTITNNEFEFSFSQFGSVFNMFLENQYVYVAGNTYQFNFASRQGSILNAIGENDQSLIKMENENIRYQFSYNGTLGISSFNLNKLSLILKNVKMNNFYASAGAALYLSKAQKVLIQNSQFTQTWGQYGIFSTIKSRFSATYHTLDEFIDTRILNNLTNINLFSKKGQIYAEQTDGSGQNNFFKQLVQTSNDQYESYIEVDNCLFQNLYADESSVIYLSESKAKFFNDIGTSNGIYNCSEIKYGVISIESLSTFHGINLHIDGSKSQKSGSVFAISSESTGFFFNSQFTNNIAQGQGIGIVEGSSYLNCTFCQFIGNQAYDSSVIFADNNPDSYSVFHRSLFQNNTSYTNMFYIIYTTIYVTQSIFLDNIAKTVNHGFTLSNSQLEMTNSTVNYTNQDFLNQGIYDTDSGFFSVNFQSSVNIKSSIFSNCRAKLGGVLSATGSSNISIGENSLFEQNYAESGSTLYFSSTNVVNVNQSTFYNNSLIDIWVVNAKANIYRNSFSLGNQQFVYGETAAINILENSFKDGTNFNVYGKAIYCFCKSLTVLSSNFQNLSSAAGGAIFITSVTKESTFLIQNNSFTSNYAQLGGALHIQDGALLSILNNTFLSNIAQVVSPQTQTTSNLLAKGQGGAIFYNCLNSDLQLTGLCNVTIGQSNKFYYNQAQNDGGAIIWISNNFTDDGTNYYQGNTAYYGDNIGSYPNKLNVNFKTNNDYVKPINQNSARRVLSSDQALSKYDFNSMNNRMLQSDSDGFANLVSGIPFQFEIDIIDSNGNIYTADSYSIATILPDDPSILLKNNIVTANKGIYNFSNIIIYSPQNVSFGLQIDIQGLTTYGNNISFIDAPLNLASHFRGCVEGEEYTANLACIACPAGQFIYEVSQNYSECQKCSTDSATCYGKNVTAPLPGFWRANATTESWQQCPRATSCLGGNESTPTGVCAEGYQGTVCAVCQDNFSRQPDFACALCPPKVRNIIQVSFVMAFTVGYTVFLTRSAMKGAQEVKPVYSVFLKIMTNYFQIIGAISNIDFEWPSQIEKFFNAQTKTSQVSQQIFSYDCFFMASPVSNTIGVYYMKLFLYGFSPIILTLISVIFWAIYCKIKKNFTYFKDCTISTVVILMFMMHPNITQAMFDSFNCIKIDGTYYLRSDMSSVCYQGRHKFYMLVIVIPSCILWVIGIPFFALICLIQNKQIILKSTTEMEDLNEVDKQKVINLKMKYGFLFQGFRLEIYYWEIIMFYRKILLIMATVFLSVVSSESQVLCSLFIIFINTILHIFLQPYTFEILNKIEMYSLFVATMTMYVGMFFITGKYYSYMGKDALRWFFLAMIILPNAFYFTYWVYYFNIEILKEVFRKVYYKKPKLFKIITCGLINPEKFKERYGLYSKEELDELKKYKDELQSKKLEEKENSPDNDNAKQKTENNKNEEQTHLMLSPDEIKLKMKKKQQQSLNKQKPKEVVQDSNEDLESNNEIPSSKNKKRYNKEIGNIDDSIRERQDSQQVILNNRAQQYKKDKSEYNDKIKEKIKKQREGQDEHKNQKEDEAFIQKSDESVLAKKQQREKIIKELLDEMKKFEDESQMDLEENKDDLNMLENIDLDKEKDNKKNKSKSFTFQKGVPQNKRIGAAQNPKKANRYEDKAKENERESSSGNSISQNDPENMDQVLDRKIQRAVLSEMQNQKPEKSFARKKIQ